jgi:protein-S-isoprenylcysteine O-methyltransferase Ste14
MSDYGSLNISTGLQVTLLILMIPPWVYAIYSIVRFFTFDRAYGIDHWHPEKIKAQGMVTEGIYKFTNHGMYFYAILILWILAIGFRSQWALIGAFFNHVAVWIHYHATEKPDIKIIYQE